MTRRQQFEDSVVLLTGAGRDLETIKLDLADSSKQAVSEALGREVSGTSHEAREHSKSRG